MTTPSENTARQPVAFVTIKQWMKYLFAVIIIGIIISATGFILPAFPQVAFLINIFSFLLVGIWFWKRVKPLADYRKDFTFYLVKISIFSFLFLLASYVAGYLIFNNLFPGRFPLLNFVSIMPAAAIVSMVPLFFDLAFQTALDIPERVYKKWVYPDKPLIMDMENIDLSNFAVITFVFSKKYGENSNSNFQSKAPYPIKLGELFYFFVQEWNFKNPGNTIDYADTNGAPFRWNFIMKKSWWYPKIYLDPDLSIRENKIKVNAIIKTERVYL